MHKAKLLIIFFLSVVFLTGCVSVRDTANKDQTNSPRQLEPMINDTPQPNHTIVMKTNKGDITIELFNQTMPITANNFLRLVNEGFYNGLIFHRVIEGFMIQSGDPLGTGAGGPGYTIPDEFSKDNHNARGTLSMANRGPDTGGSQFFINVVDNDYLDDKHPVFGKVIEGMEVVDAIVLVGTDGDNKPLSDVVIEEIIVKE